MTKKLKSTINEKKIALISGKNMIQKEIKVAQRVYKVEQG